MASGVLYRHNWMVCDGSKGWLLRAMSGRCFVPFASQLQGGAQFGDCSPFLPTLPAATTFNIPMYVHRFVLLKERNMLNTVRLAARSEKADMPSPERLHKVVLERHRQRRRPNGRVCQPADQRSQHFTSNAAPRVRHQLLRLPSANHLRLPG